MTIQENVMLAPFTTFRIGGKARFFVQAKNVEDIKKATDFAQSNGIAVFVLGGGSNLLISDQGFDGLVIKNEIFGITEEQVSNDDGEVVADKVRLIVGAGENWDGFVEHAVVKKNLYGLENLSLIPGTVGAAPVQNIGAYGAEVKDTIEWVEVYDPTSQKIEKLQATGCHFGYRDSIFKHERKDNIILRIAFLLKKQGILSTEYKDLKNYFVERRIEVSLHTVREAVMEIRRKKLPDISKIGTAGSFFKNAIISKEQYQKLTEKYPEMPLFPVDETNVKVPTAWILDNVCGFKGVRRGNVGVYENQALVLVNLGGATAKEVKDLANEMIACVKEKTGITISPEVEFVNLVQSNI